MKGLRSLGIESSCYLRIHHRDSFYSVLSEKGLCRWAMPQCWWTDKPGESECVSRASHVSCSKHERKEEGYLSGGTARDAQEHNTPQQKLSLVSTYQCEEQISLFLFYCHIDTPVTIFNSRELYTVLAPLLLTWHPSFTLICLSTWNS